jgi:tRNA-dihydrouridine synthase B
VNRNSVLPITAGEPWLAPLAGYSDLPFRLLCRELGAAAAVTEMVSAKGLVYGSPGTEPLLDTCDEDSPLAVQVFGAEKSFIERALAKLLERGFVNFDLNAGCSVRKVVKTGAGAALMADPSKPAALAAAMVEMAGPGRVGVKMRLGPRPGRDTYLECARRLEDAGVAWLCLHPRHAAQGFGGRADREALAKLVHAVSLPVIASGDLFSAEDAADCIRQTGVSAVMFARGALADPAVFTRYRDLMAGRDPADRAPSEIRAVVERHVELVRRHARDETKELKRMRTIVPRYVKGLPGASRLRSELVEMDSWSELAVIARRIDSANC